MPAKALIRTFSRGSRVSDTWLLWPFGDTHVGARGCDENAIRRDVAEIAENPRAYWIGMGDYIDAVQSRDPRSDPDTVADWMLSREAMRDIVGAQRDRFLSLTAPIHHKCLGMIEGNHERTVLKYFERDVYREIVGAVQQVTPWANEPFALGDGGYIRMKFARDVEQKAASVSLDIFAAHGHGGGRLKGAKALQLGRLGGWFGADIILVGHSHDPLTTPTHRVWCDRAGNIRIRRTLAINAGGYLKTWGVEGSTYATRGLMGPLAVGTPYIIINPNYTNGFDDERSIRAIV